MYGAERRGSGGGIGFTFHGGLGGNNDRELAGGGFGFTTHALSRCDHTVTCQFSLPLDPLPRAGAAEAQHHGETTTNKYKMSCFIELQYSFNQNGLYICHGL